MIQYAKKTPLIEKIEEDAKGENTIRRVCYGYARRFFQDHYTCEDIASEVHLKMIQHHNAYNKPISKSAKMSDPELRNWWFTICINTVNNYLRKIYNRKDVSLDQIEDDDGHRISEPWYDPFTELVEAEEKAATCNKIILILEELPIMESTRHTFYLHLQGMKDEQIAEELNIPHPTVRSRLSVLRKKLRAGIQEDSELEERIKLAS